MATEQKETSDPCAKYNEQTNFLSKTIFASLSCKASMPTSL